ALPGVVFRTYGFAPHALQGAAYVVALEIDNSGGDADISGLSLFSLHNVRHNAERPSPSGTGEYLSFENGAFVEEGAYQNSGAVSVYDPLNAPSLRTSGGTATDPTWATNPYHVLADLNQDFAQAMSAAFTPYNADDIALGFEWPSLAVAAGASAWV